MISIAQTKEGPNNIFFNLDLTTCSTAKVTSVALTTVRPSFELVLYVGYHIIEDDILPFFSNIANTLVAVNFTGLNITPSLVESTRHNSSR